MEFSPDDRRDFMRRCAGATLGVTFAGGLSFGTADSDLFFNQASAAATKGKAKHIIYLFMEGAMSHLDSFDPKVGIPEAGQTKAISTSVPGVQFGDRFPKLGQLAGGLSVIRSLSTETGDHDKGRYLMRTGYKKINSTQHPSMGGWMLDVQGRLNKDIPGNYVLGGASRHPGAGFLEPSLSPVPIAKPENGLSNTELPSYLPPQLFDRRLNLASRFDEVFQKGHSNSAVNAYNQLYKEARNLIGSEHLAVFDLKLEPENVREAYGDSSFGQGCLLARRLVQSGARFVEVTLDGWDMHTELYERLTDSAAILDNAMSTLLRDLHFKGMLEDTLVVLTTEFGRKPVINFNGGRDHHPGAFCSLLAGAGIQTGGVYGASDKTGHSVDESHMSVADFNTTIAAAAGLPYEKEFFAPNGRPFKIGGGGEVVTELLS